MNALRRAASVAAEEVCEICAVPIGEEHEHLVDVRDHRLLCACRGCYLLFVPQGAAQGRYRAVGERYVRLDATAFEGPAWEALQIPIGLAFFLRASDGAITAFYPGPGGATQSLLPLDGWDALARGLPQLANLQPDIEAVLVRRARDTAAQAYIVPVDRCYELTGIVRTQWRGFTGGPDMEASLERFFDRLREQCR
jgi:Family of unknown function (DUF5947)